MFRVAAAAAAAVAVILVVPVIGSKGTRTADVDLA